MDQEKVSTTPNSDKSYTEASVPTPANQEDVSALDKVSEAVEEVMDNMLAGDE